MTDKKGPIRSKEGIEAVKLFESKLRTAIEACSGLIEQDKYINYSFSLLEEESKLFNKEHFAEELYLKLTNRGLKGIAVFCSLPDKVFCAVVCEVSHEAGDGEENVKQSGWLDIFRKVYFENKNVPASDSSTGLKNGISEQAKNYTFLWFIIVSDYKKGFDASKVEEEMLKDSCKYLIKNEMVTLDQEDEGDDPCDYNEYYESLGLDLLS